MVQAELPRRRLVLSETSYRQAFVVLVTRPLPFCTAAAIHRLRGRRIALGSPQAWDWAR